MGSAGQGYILSDLAYLFYKNSIGAATYQEIVNMLLEAVWHRWHSRLPYPSVWLWYLVPAYGFGLVVTVLGLFSISVPLFHWNSGCQFYLAQLSQYARPVYSC